VARLNGYYPPHKFEVVLDYVAGHHEQKQKLADYYRARDPAPVSGKLHHEPFFLPGPLKLAGRPRGKHLAVLFEQDIWSKEKLQTPDGRELPMDRWAAQLGVQYAPTWIFFDGDGNEVFRAEAWLKAFHLHGIIDYVATGAYRWQPNFQRFLQHRTDVLHAKGFDVDLMK